MADNTPEPVAAPITVDAVLEATTEDERNDTNSLLTSSTGSLTESIREYREVHGRTYSQKTDYWGPNDERQNDALDFNHFWMTELFDDKLFLAPIGDSPQRVLDLGTGTGIWAIDFADTYPSAEVIGIDISPTQPTWVPPNVKFQIEDFEQDWTWPEEYFDYVHARNLEGCFKDLPRFFEQLYAHTKPGGWFEIIEFDGHAYSQSQDLDDEHIYNKWWRLARESQEKLGKPHDNAADRRHAKGLIEAGFVDLVEKKYKIPIGTWPAKPDMKKLGFCNLKFVEQALEGFMLHPLKEVLGYTYEETQVMISEMRSCIKDPKLATFYYLHVAYARKPEKEEKKESTPTA